MNRLSKLPSRLRRFKNNIARTCRRYLSEVETVKYFPEILKYGLSGKNRAYYVGWLGYDNLGDEAMYKAVKKMYSGCAWFYANRHDSGAGKMVPRFFNPHTVFLGGGTLIGLEIYLTEIQRTLNLNAHARYVVFGTGVEDAGLWESFGEKVDVKGWLDSIEKADYIGVRGPISKEELKKWGVKKEIHVTGDPAIWFAEDAVKPKKLKKRIGINLGPSRGNIYGQDETKVLAFGVALISLLHENGWDITLFPMIPDDADYLNEIKKQSCLNHIPLHGDFLNLSGTLDALETQDVFVGEKLHSVILASCVYTPGIMLSYRTKCRDFMKSINREEMAYTTDRLDHRVIYEHICDIYGNIEHHQKQLFFEIQSLKKVLTSAVDHVKAVIQ